MSQTTKSRTRRCEIVWDNQSAVRKSESANDPPSVNLKCANINYKPFGKDLVMASLNINSLLARMDGFRIFMNESDIDIISINETKLDS